MQGSASERGQVITLSTFPPRRCGLATFSAHLIEAVAETGLMDGPAVIAMSQSPAEHQYGESVVLEIVQDRRADYLEAARYANAAGGIVNLQHEFGIFGGEDGEYLLDFLYSLRIPLVTTLHTVLSQPDPRKLELTRRIAERSQVVVVLARLAVDILREVYGINGGRVTFIPHGAPTVSVAPRQTIRRRLGLSGRSVLCTMGLINPGKGIEYVLEALPDVVGRHPEALYLVLGQTHPGVKRFMGEAYRDKLREMVRTLGLEAHVRFVDTYLSQEELVDYLVATDIYVTPYLGREQIVSGTLAYAMGLGKAVVSTPYFYAEELLGEGRGLLVDFRDPGGMAQAINRLLDRPELRTALEMRAAALGREMSWSRVGHQYARLFLESLGADAAFAPAARLLADAPPGLRRSLRRGGAGSSRARGGI